MLHLLVLSLFTILTSAQVIDVAGTLFDVDGCVNPHKAYNCWQQAHADFNAVSCNSSSNEAQCAYETGLAYAQQSIDCIVVNCWNRAASCEFQHALHAYTQAFHIGTDTVDINVPPFYDLGFGPRNFWDDIPGRCACNIPLVTAQFVRDPYNQCDVHNNVEPANVTGCGCCAWGEILALVEDLCPRYDLTLYGIKHFIDNAKQNSSHCEIWQASDWQVEANKTCPSLGSPPVNNTGWLNPQSLPSTYTGTATLSDMSGSVTALSQFSVTATTYQWVWVESHTTVTYTFEQYTAAVASSTAVDAATTDSTTYSYSFTPTTSYVGTTLPSVTGAAVTAPSTTSATSTSSATSGAGARREMAPLAMGLMGMVLVMG